MSRYLTLVVFLFINLASNCLHAESREEANDRAKEEQELLRADRVLGAFEKLQKASRDAADSLENPPATGVVNPFDLEGLSRKHRLLIEQRREEMRNVIRQIARTVAEKRSYAIQVERGVITTSDERSSFKRALDGIELSVADARIAIETAYSVGSNLREDAIKERDPQRRFDLTVDYTAFVYEMNTVVIEILDSLDEIEVHRESIARLRDERAAEVNRFRRQVEESKARIRKISPTNEIPKPFIESYDMMLRSVEATELSWDRIWLSLDKQKISIEKLKQQRSMFEINRILAGDQLDAAQLIREAKEIHDFFGQIDELVDIRSLEPILITPEDVSALFDRLDTHQLERLPE